VVYSFTRACLKETRSPTARTYLIDIVGALEVLDGKTNVLEGVRAIDEHTATITVSRTGVAYDPTGPFVTANGNFTSPAGAYTPNNPGDPNVTGTAHIGFLARYEHSATVPTGHRRTMAAPTALARRLPGIALEALSVHIGSQLTDIGPFRDAFARHYPQARWVIALHHHLVEYPKPAKAFSERIGTALINGSWFVRVMTA